MVYVENDIVVWVEILYYGDELLMLVILFKDVVGLEEFEGLLDWKIVRSW